MKRPQGFPGPGTGAPAKDSSPRPPLRAPRAEAATEPIPIQAGLAREPATASTTAETPARDTPLTAAPATEKGSRTQASTEKPLTPARARKQLRAARRARKQYERDEVRRFTQRARRRRRTWFIAIGAVAALVAFVLVGAFSPLMALRTIDVIGSKRIPPTEITAALRDQIGTPLPLLDAGRIKRDLAGFTLIQSYVTESRPPGTLVVRIVEREPVGVIVSQARFDLVDAAGVVIQSGKTRPAGYPLIDANSGVSGAGFQAAAAVVTALPDSVRTQLDSVTAATKDDVTLTLTGGARVVWGSAEKSEYKAVVLQALMVKSPVGSVAEYDVSSPDSAVLR